MSTSGPASDTFIGRLFKRIVPGSSYAAFPWKSWDKVCTILETIRGRGCRIKRSHKDNEWEIDATDGIALDKPHAYSVFVLDIESARERAEELPPSMMEDISNTDLEGGVKVVYVYCPYMDSDTGDSDDENDKIAGVNGQFMSGKIGDMADEEWPEGSHWGWRRIGQFTYDEPMVVYGTIDERRFTDISVCSEATFAELVSGGEMDDAEDAFVARVPIAWITGSNVVQTLCGRPWQVGGEDDVVVCKILASSMQEDWTTGVSVALYEDGAMFPSTGTGIVYLPEVGQSTKPVPGSQFVAHRKYVRILSGSIVEDASSGT